MHFYTYLCGIQIPDEAQFKNLRLYRIYQARLAQTSIGAVEQSQCAMT